MLIFLPFIFCQNNLFGFSKFPRTGQSVLSEYFLKIFHIVITDRVRYFGNAHICQRKQVARIGDTGLLMILDKGIARFLFEFRAQICRMNMKYFAHFFKSQILVVVLFDIRNYFVRCGGNLRFHILGSEISCYVNEYRYQIAAELFLISEKHISEFFFHVKQKLFYNSRIIVIDGVCRLSSVHFSDQSYIFTCEDLGDRCIVAESVIDRGRLKQNIYKAAGDISHFLHPLEFCQFVGGAEVDQKEVVFLHKHRLAVDSVIYFAGHNHAKLKKTMRMRRCSRLIVLNIYYYFRRNIVIHFNTARVVCVFIQSYHLTHNFII